MLILCPECGLQVSDRASACPHCGYPMKKNIPHKRVSTKRRRLPNGFGQISEIKNRNLRKPFRAMVTVGKNIVGRPICKPLKPESYFASYNDAYAALVEYNRNPHDLSPGITLQELYEKWSEKHFENVTRQTALFITQTWNMCSSVHKMRVKDLRGRHIKDLIANMDGKPFVQTRIKSTFNAMLDYAVEYELVDRNVSRQFNISKDIVKDAMTVKNSHMVFSDEEMKKLWSHADSVDFVDAVLIQCYSGWRPQELSFLEIENIDLENWTFKGGMKTDAGKDRVVPIHPKVRDLVLREYDSSVKAGSRYLFSKTDKPLKYSQYAKLFGNIVTVLGLDPKHRPHDGRKHFVTLAKKYGVDEYTIKYFVGHHITDITEQVYTQRDLSWFQAEMQKIK